MIKTAGILILLTLGAFFTLYTSNSPKLQLNEEQNGSGICPKSSAFDLKCEEAGGVSCGYDLSSNYECCQVIGGKSTCEYDPLGFWKVQREVYSCQYNGESSRLSIECP